MNHSIYSADRTTHLKIVVVALVAGIVVAGLRHLGAQQRRTMADADRARDEGRQAGGDHQLEQFARSLTEEFHGIHAALYSPPKSPRGY